MLHYATHTLAGYEILGVFSESIGGEIYVAPRTKPDLVIFSVKDGKLFLTTYFYDGWTHFHDQKQHTGDVFHERFCPRGGRSLLYSEKYLEQLSQERKQKLLLEEIYGATHEVRYVRENYCLFHSTVQFNGRTFDSPWKALEHARVVCPKLNIAVPFQKRISLKMLQSDPKNENDPLYCGFIVVTGHMPEDSPYFNREIGPCISKRKLTAADLGPNFEKSLEDSLKMEVRDSVERKRATDSYIEALTSTRKLVLSQSMHSASISLDMYKYLSQIGFITTKVDHILLFARLSHKSKRSHSFYRFVDELLSRREAFTAEIKLCEQKLASESEPAERDRLIKTILQRRLWSQLVKVSPSVCLSVCLSSVRRVVRGHGSVVCVCLSHTHTHTHTHRQTDRQTHQTGTHGQTTGFVFARSCRFLSIVFFSRFCVRRFRPIRCMGKVVSSLETHTRSKVARL